MTSDPHPVDIIVGANLRRIRNDAAMSLIELAEAVGVSYQQVRKYECAIDRISASMLWECAQALDVPVQAFFVRPQ